VKGANTRRTHERAIQQEGWVRVRVRIRVRVRVRVRVKG
jgi:hypothetical protein